MQAAHYTVTVTRTAGEVIFAFVSKPDGTRYAVRLAGGAQGGCGCSCPHSMYRGIEACKHAVAVQDHLRAAHAAALDAHISGQTTDWALVEAAQALYAMASAWVQNAQVRDAQAAAAQKQAA